MRKTKGRRRDLLSVELCAIPPDHPWLREREARIQAIAARVEADLARLGFDVNRPKKQPTKVYHLTCAHCGRTRELTPHRYHSYDPAKFAAGACFCSMACARLAQAQRRKTRTA